MLNNVTVQLLSHLQLFVTPWTVANQAPLSKGFSRQEYWSGQPFLLQGIFPTQGLNLVSCIAGGFFMTAPPGKPTFSHNPLFFLCSSEVFTFLNSSQLDKILSGKKGRLKKTEPSQRIPSLLILVKENYTQTKL